MSSIKKVAVIGTGVIGTGWIIRCLAHNKIVYAFDKDPKLKNSLIKEIKRTWPFVKKLFKKKNKTINKGRASIELVIAVHPRSGGIAPAIPPITIFCVPANLRTFV